ncbi:MAG: citrate/2-methylcitrate synthase [Syntrophomonas sp.]|nr:citrate/2-methylcitrate synthase [Syntrophomonas sp.]
MDLVDKLSVLAENNNKIDIELYSKYNVKRGLRNNDGTGVLVGLTEIGDVHSYIMDEREKVPVEGELRYRGIDINEITQGFIKDNRFGFEECCYLLLFGELPDSNSLAEFKDLLGINRFLPDNFTEDMILKAPSKDVMNKMALSVLAMYSYDPNPDDTSIKNVLRQSIELIARFPTMAAYSYQAKVHNYDGKSLYIRSPHAELSTAENILHIIKPNSKYTELEARVLDLALVLHAEHGGGNNSAFITHAITSTGTDTYSAIAAALGALKGPQHGGANLKVMSMMEDIKSNIKDWEDETEVAGYLEKILNKQAFDRTGLIYGIGHAVYTLSDPRTTLLKQKAQCLAREKGMEKEFNLYALIERIAHDVFVKVRHNDNVICANVDFYSGFVYSMLNIPIELFTPIFAIGRIPGWCAHRIEEIISGGKLIRPAYKNVIGKKEYIKMPARDMAIQNKSNDLPLEG